MKTEFSKNYILSNRGCYERKKVMIQPFINNETITLKDLFDELPIEDFTWFLVRKCDLTLNEKRWFALACAKHVLPIYENQYPNDKRVRECIEATEDYLNNKISKEELCRKRSDAACASDDAIELEAAYAYACAAAYDYDAYAAYDYASACASAVNDAYAAGEKYRQFVWNYVTKNLIKI